MAAKRSDVEDQLDTFAEQLSEANRRIDELEKLAEKLRHILATELGQA